MYPPGGPCRVMEEIFGVVIERKVEMPVVPSVFGEPTVEVRSELPELNAVSVRKSKLVYQMPTTLSGVANEIVTVRSTGSQTTIEPE